MGFFGFKNKMDKTLTPYIKLNSKKKLPIIVLCTNKKLVKSKILTNNGIIKYEYNLIDAFACEMTPMSIDKLSFIPEVRYVCYDHLATTCMRKTTDITGFSLAQVMNLSGKGVGIGIIDTGVYPHADLVSNRRCVKQFRDLINKQEYPYDDNGHGTFICGCISGSGSMSDGLFCGIAPNSNLYIIKAFNAAGYGNMSDLIMAIELLLEFKKQEPIQLLCLPFELPGTKGLKINPLELAIQKTVELGMTVICPSGNHGPSPYSINSPGNMDCVLTVGGVDTTIHNYKNYRIPEYSGRGPTFHGQSKPNLVAPCNAVTSLMADIQYKPSHAKPCPIKTQYTTKSGTSISCAIICGYAALMLEKNPELTAVDIKSLLELSSVSLGESKYAQGSGMFVYGKAILNKNQDES